MTIRIRRGVVGECGRLTEIALAAKRHWGYPEDWIELWREELTYRPETLATQDVLVAEVAGEIIAVCSVSVEADEAELDGLWVLPARIGRGLGSALLEAACAAAAGRGARTLRIASDPGAA